MNKIKFSWLFLSVVALLVTAGGCNNNPQKLTVEDVTELAQTYFAEQYDLDVTVISVQYQRVGQNDYLNTINVSDGKQEYRLFLDRRNKPASDDVSATQRINSIDVYSYDEILASLGLARPAKIYGLISPEYCGLFYTQFGIEHGVALGVKMIDRDKCSQDGIYSLLGILREDGIDELIIGFSEPINNNHNFYTDMDIASFQEEYDSFVERTSMD